RAENSGLQHDLNLQRDLVGDTPAMAELANVIGKAGPTNSTVLVQGETGTGKGLVARHSSQQQAIRRAFCCYQLRRSCGKPPRKRIVRIRKRRVYRRRRPEEGTIRIG